MLTQSSLCSNAQSYLINYQIQATLFKWADKKAETIQWLRLSGIALIGASSLITVATRIAGIAEVFLKGSYLILTAPFSENRLYQAKLGFTEAVLHTSENVLRLLYVPIEIFINTVSMLIEPKYFTIGMVEYTSVDLLHAKNGTLHTREHNTDLINVAGINNGKFLAFQRRSRPEGKSIEILPRI